MGCTLTMHWHLLKQNKLLCAIMTWIFKKILTLEWRTVNRITRHGGQLSLAWLAAQYWDERHFQRATVQTQNTENQCPETSNQTQNREKHYPKKRNSEIYVLRHRIKQKTKQRKQCGFSIYTFDNLKSKSMVRLVRAEKTVLSGLVFARKIARMILNQNI